MLLLWWKDRYLFLAILLLSIGIGIALWMVQKVSFRAELTMNVAREGIRQTEEYSYDDFYRLQADERFADTVVRWLESPRIVSDIERESGVLSRSLSFDAGRLSSQVIRIRFAIPEARMAKPVSLAVFSVLNREAASLNRGEQPGGWFVLVGDTPSVSDARFPLSRALMIASALGVFFGCWGILFARYMKGSNFD